MSKTRTRKPAAAPMPIQTPVPPPEPREIAPPSRLPAARSIFTSAGLAWVEGAEPSEPWRVADKFHFWPLSGRWAEDNEHPLAKLATGRHGYGAHALALHIRNQAIDPAALEAVRVALDPTIAPPTVPAEPVMQDHQHEQVAQ